LAFNVITAAVTSNFKRQTSNVKQTLNLKP